MPLAPIECVGAPVVNAPPWPPVEKHDGDTTAGTVVRDVKRVVRPWDAERVGLKGRGGHVVGREAGGGRGWIGVVC